MPLRIPLILALSAPLTFAVLYAATVERGPSGMREALPWEVTASGYVSLRTRIFAEQRMPEYPRPIRWLAPSFADLHALDVQLRWAYWHEQLIPDFDNPPDFQLAK